MPIDILMPALSPTMQEGKLTSWLKQEGDKINPGDIIAEIETDKAIMEVDTPFKGTLGKILIQEGTVAVGTKIAILLQQGEDACILEKIIADKPQDSMNATTEDITKNKKEEIINQPAICNIVKDEKQYNSDRKFISPLAKVIAKQNNLDYSNIAGSGPMGRIVKSDIEKIIFNKNKPTVRQDSTQITASQMRKVIAKRLTESKQTIPHFYISSDIEFDNLLATREIINSLEKGKISINDIIVKAVATALKAFPEVNSYWQDPDKIIMLNNIDIAVAVSINQGLITPIVKNVDQKNIFEISQEIKNLAKAAKEGQLLPEQYNGGSLTISNMGMFKVSKFNAIINPPQSLIIAVGSCEKKPIVKDNNITIANICNITLSVDHRVIDGTLAAEFSNEIKNILQNPILMFI
jgi:pyruvate dehydrogenase E2 component (dihydrolipoamide acetyltransferase)